ncbi:MAG: HAD family hydrolase, partial [Gammaproteobacteria bacterium]
MKIILLDVGNVLLTVDFSGFCKTLAGGDPALEKVIEQRYCRGLHKEDLDSGKTTPAQFFQTVASDPDTADIGLEAIEAHWVDLFTVIEDAPASVETLKSRYTVWIASDTDPAHFRHYSQRYPFIGQNDR